MSDIDVSAEYKGVKVPQSPYLNETRIARINAGQYEGQEIAGALSVVSGSDRVIEMGAGIGFVGAVIAANAKPEAMLSFEANPALMPHIQTLYALNGLGDRIRVANEVLLASPERPESIDFHVAGSYLGSSLIQNARRTKQTVSVPTRDFEALRQEFRPTVLIMDIEGGELDLLEHADLTGIRAVILEFHPDAYGMAGMRRCKSILRAAGFARKNDVSTRTVWTCTREAAPLEVPEDPPPLDPPNPKRGWSHEIKVLDQAMVLPAVANGFAQAAGLRDSDGRYCPEGALWRNHRPLTTAPEIPEAPLRELKGTWLWGGVLWEHFGHFICESTARLWPLPNLADQVDGVLFMPKRPRKGARVLPFQSQLVDLLVPGMPVKSLYRPHRVERLIVPGQGFGLGRMSKGTPLYRKAIAENFAKGFNAEGPEKLYISRSALPGTKGGLIEETRIERYLEAQGYTIFHPQQHDLLTQVAHYKAAKVILAAEGSALHLVAMTARADQKIGVLQRRKSTATAAIVAHIRGISGVPPVIIDALVRNWRPAHAIRTHTWLGEIDFGRLQQRLQEQSFIAPDGPTWVSPDEETVRALLGSDFVLAERHETKAA